MNAEGNPQGRTLRTNGLPVPPDFPVDPYEFISETMGRKFGQHALYGHLAGAWNALVYRYQETADAGNHFAALLRQHGTAPVPAHRYAQERAIFDFYSAGFSACECAFYGFYAIGTLLSGNGFTLTTERDQQRVNPTSTRDTFTNAFPDDPFAEVLSRVLAEADVQNWRAVRNVLTHRTAPGRRMYVSVGRDDDSPTEWKLNNMPLDETIAINGRRTLVHVLEHLLVGGAEFVAGQVR